MKKTSIGGQAVMEGVMMKNLDRYAVAVRKPDHEIEVMTDEYKVWEVVMRFLAYRSYVELLTLESLYISD